MFLKIKDMHKSKSKKSFFENPKFAVVILTVWFPVTFKFPLKREFRFKFQVYVGFLHIIYSHFTFIHTAATEVNLCFGEFVVRKLRLSDFTNEVMSTYSVFYHTRHVSASQHLHMAAY
jgi:hypothetical protein